MTTVAASSVEPVRVMSTDTVDTDDRALLARIAGARDAAAFERLYHSYRRRLGPFTYRIVRDAAANEEVFNDVMLTVWRKAGTYSGTSKVSTWIFAIAYRQCLKALRNRPDTVGLDGLDEPGRDESPARERRDLVAVALAQLSPEHRLVIELSYFQGNTYQEIAAIAACPESTVKTRVFYARRKLKEIMGTLGETGVAGGQQENES